MNGVIQAVLASAIGATGAGAGWVLAIRGDQLAVIAAIGVDGLVGTEVSADVGTAGFVVTSGQPLAIAARAGDARLSEGVFSLLDELPTSILSVPCSSAERTVGALELIEKMGGGRFTFDDVELATLLAGIAAAAIEECGNEVSVRPPAELASDFRRLASSDPVEYARVASLVEAILARG